MSGMILVFLVLFVLQATTGYWWWVLVVPFLCGAFRSKSSGACLRSSALGAGLLWLIGGVFALLTDSYQIAAKVATMGGIGSPLLAVAIAALVAALAGSVAGLTGFQVRSMIGLGTKLRDIHSVRRLGGKKHDRHGTERKDRQDSKPPTPGGAGR